MDSAAPEAATFPFSAVIFDMDGVIVDTERYYWDELRALADGLGIDVTDEELNAQVGQSTQAFLRMLVDWYARAGRELTLDGAAEAYEGWAATRTIDYAALLNPGVRELLEGLSERGVRVALASSSPAGNIREVLAACGLTGAFEVVVSGVDFTESKPSPEIYLHTLDRLGLPAEACCCIEDSVPGITAGKRAGLTVFAKREDRFGFSQDGADAIIDRVDDLLEAAPRLAAARAR